MKTILILDDEETVRQSFIDFFEDCLWHPIPAGSAEQALSILETAKLDAAIVDVRLPGMNGNDFIRQAVTIAPSMVCIICTGSPEYYVPQDLQEMPTVCNHLYKKPVTSLQQLQQEIVQLMEVTMI